MSGTVNLVNGPWLGVHKEGTYYYYLAKWSCCPSVQVPSTYLYLYPQIGAASYLTQRSFFLQWAVTVKWSASSESSISPPLKVQGPQQKRKKEFKNKRMGRSVYNVLLRI